MKNISVVYVVLFIATTQLLGMPVAPFQPTPAPAMPMGAPVQPAVVPPPPPVPAALPAVTMPPAPPQAVQAPLPQPMPLPQTATQGQQTNAPEFDQIAAALGQLQSARNAIAEAMKDLDEKMQSARNDMAQARKLSLSILSKTNEAEAKTALDQVNALLQTMQNYQNDVQNQTSKTIDQNYNQMQTQFATIQEKIRNLQARGVTLQVSQAQAIITKAEATLNEVKKESDTTITEKPKSKGMIRTFFSGVADWIMAGFKSIHGAYRGVIEYLAGSPASSADADQKKKSIAAQPPTSDKVRELLAQCDQCTKSLEFSYISLQERSLRLEESIAAWGKESPIFAHLTRLETSDGSDYLLEGKSTIKKFFVGWFSWLLDGCFVAVYPIVWTIKTVYQKTIGWIINKVVRDIKDTVTSNALDEKVSQQKAASTQVQTTPPQTQQPVTSMPVTSVVAGAN